MCVYVLLFSTTNSVAASRWFAFSTVIFHGRHAFGGKKINKKHYFVCGFSTYTTVSQSQRLRYNVQVIAAIVIIGVHRNSRSTVIGFRQSAIYSYNCIWWLHSSRSLHIVLPCDDRQRTRVRFSACDSYGLGPRFYFISTCVLSSRGEMRLFRKKSVVVC